MNEQVINCDYVALYRWFYSFNVMQFVSTLAILLRYPLLLRATMDMLLQQQQINRHHL